MPSFFTPPTGPGNAPNITNPPVWNNDLMSALSGYLPVYAGLYGTQAQAQMGQGPFAGIGSVDLAKNDATAQAEANKILTPAQVELMKQYGPQLAQLQMDQLKQIDPERFALNKQLESTALGDLSKGDQLTDDQSRMMNDAIRGAQEARGNFQGAAPTADEVIQKFNYGQQLKQQRMANAGAALGTNPYAAPSTVTSASQSQTPQPMAPWQQGLQVDPNAPLQGANQNFNSWLGYNSLNQQNYGLNLQNYGLRLGGWGTSLAYPQTSFGEQLPGMLMGGLGNLASSALRMGI